MNNKIPVTIDKLQEGLLAKKFTAVEVVDEYLANIKKHNHVLNAFLTLTENEAYTKAKEVDELLARNDPEILKKFPLLGVPIAHKDLFLTKGIRTTASSKVLESYIPQYSGTVVERFDKAGAILVGKTNCDAWAHGASGENSDFGATKNPWNTKFVPGGSSSGSAVSVAANLVLASTGTDTGGSIRQPANFCGVVGFKPTYGAVSRFGVIAMASSLDSVGHFTHTVSDARKIFSVTKGEDGRDSTVKNGEYLETPGRLRLGLPEEYFVEGLDPVIEKSVKDTVKYFEGKGIEVKKVSLPNTKYGISVYYIIQQAEVSSNLGRYDGIRYGNTRDKMGSEAKRRIMLGTYVLSAGYYDAYYLKAMKVRAKIIKDFEKVFSEVDAIIAPVSPTLPFKLGEKADDPLKMYLADVFTVSANIAGLPGLAIPSGFSKDNLPLGFQLIGPRFSENILFDLGVLYQKDNQKEIVFPKF